MHKGSGIPKSTLGLPIPELESLAEAARAVVTAHMLRDDDKGSDRERKRCDSQPGTVPSSTATRTSVKSQPCLAKSASRCWLDRDGIANDYAGEFVPVHQRDGGLDVVPRLCQRGPGKVAGRNEHPFGCRTQSSPKVVDLWTADGMTPTLDLGLDVRSSEELIPLIDVCVKVYSAIPRRPSDGDSHESALLH